jgi:hypothetical protein
MDVSGLDTVVRASGFTGVVVVRHARTVIFEEAYGYATPRWQIANTRYALRHGVDHQTVHQCGRPSAGRCRPPRLDSSIHRYVDLSGTTISHAVSLRQVLTHTSGIADDADEEAGEVDADLFVDTPCYAIMETADLLPQFADKPALAEPGLQARYCNVGYVLAGVGARAGRR